MPKQQSASYEEIISNIKARKFEKVYLLEGNESYFIDRIVELLSDTVLTEDEKAFNFFTYYGLEADATEISNTAKSYPLGADHLLIIIREAQLFQHLDDMAYYLQRPLDTTILVICYKDGFYDRRKRLAVLAQKNGVVFESKKISDSRIAGFVSVYLKQHGITATPKAVSMLADNIGADINRLCGELDKLILSLPKGETTVTPELVEEKVGISKEFNFFELQDAIANKDVYKATQIAQYFGANPKANPIQMILVSLFRYFSKLMLSFYSPDKSLSGMAMWLNMTEWQVRKNILPAKGKYSARKVMDIISKIRETDERLKGIGNESDGDAELLFDLVFFILH